MSILRTALAEIEAALRQHDRVLVVVDGPSGAGKSTLARRLLQEWPGGSPRLIEVDDLCPGWSGLAEAGRILAEDIIAPWAAGEPARWQRYDWTRGVPGRFDRIDASTSLLVEGCGALAALEGLSAHPSTGADARPATVAIWCDAPEPLRRARALQRDPYFAPYWPGWARQFDEHRRRVRPERLDGLLHAEG